MTDLSQFPITRRWPAEHPDRIQLYSLNTPNEVKAGIMLEETEVTRGLAGRYVETYAYADGRLDVRWKGHSLPYRIFDKDQRVTHAAITENKRLGDVLAYIKERQDQRPTPKVKTNSEKVGYTPRGRKPGKRTDIKNDPAVIARRLQALSRQQAAE